MQRATMRHLLLLPYPTASAELSGCGAVGFSGAMSSMDAAMSPMDGFTRAPLNPTAPHHVPQQQKRQERARLKKTYCPAIARNVIPTM